MVGAFRAAHQAIHQTYIAASFSKDVASAISRCTWPLTDSGSSADVTLPSIASLVAAHRTVSERARSSGRAGGWGMGVALDCAPLAVQLGLHAAQHMRRLGWLLL